VIWVSNVFGAWLDQAKLSPVAWGITFTSFISFLCAMTVWQLVGIWRAAGNHIRSTGRATWGALARIAVLVGAVRAVAEFSTVTLPMLSESAMIATGRTISQRTGCDCYGTARSWNWLAVCRSARPTPLEICSTPRRQ
jgi:hypothetical protein